MDIVEPTRIELPDVTLSVHDQGEGFPVVLCHGFPELAYSWRHQISALSGAGYRAIAPDQRGYGRSDCPDPVNAYGIDTLTGDLVALLDSLDIERAVFAGHDWGGFVAWAMPVLHPDRTAGVIGVNTPYLPFLTTQLLRGAFANTDDHYILWFQQDGVAEKLLDARTRMVFEKIMRASGGSGAIERSSIAGGKRFNPFLDIEAIEPPGQPLLTPEELDYYVEAYKTAGFRGGINWYRNFDANAERHPEVGRQVLELPCLMVTAERDLALPPALAASMPERVKDLEMHMIEGCGHWTQQEKPQELSALMLDFLQRRFPADGDRA